MDYELFDYLGNPISSGDIRMLVNGEIDQNANVGLIVHEDVSIRASEAISHLRPDEYKEITKNIVNSRMYVPGEEPKYFEVDELMFDSPEHARHYRQWILGEND